ncbi:hypothetical protein [Cryptosporangium sp. NPDC048952]|uniref:hypothetical protein n=1 Tax=Cryptosporangium sp. NPDC048952 TaxID=3363961 RepID=UPI00371B03D7
MRDGRMRMDGFTLGIFVGLAGLIVVLLVILVFPLFTSGDSEPARSPTAEASR